MPENKVQIVVEVDAKTGRATIRQLGEEMETAGRKGAAGFGEASTGVDRLGQSLGPVVGLAQQLGLAIGVASAVMLAKDMAMAAALYDTLGVSMGIVGNNAGYTRAEMDGFAADLQKHGIAMTESRETLTRMAQAHIDLAQAAALARIAQDAAVIGNINSSEAFERLIHGVQSGQIEVLRTIGINVNFENSYKKLSAQLGKTTDDLTEHEKMQARVNVVMAAGSGIAGTYEAAMDTAGKQINSMQRYIDNLGVTTGSVFNDVLIVGVQGFTGVLKDANGEASRLAANGTLKVWGEGLIYTFAVLADTVAMPFKAVATFTEGLIASGFAIAKFFDMVEHATSGQFLRAKRDLEELKDIDRQYAQSNSDRWKNAGGDFTAAAGNMYSDRSRNAGRDAAASDEAEKKRIAAGAAARAQAEADEKAAAALKRQQAEAKKAASHARTLAEAWAGVKLELTDEAGAVALTGLNHELAEIDKKADKLRQKFLGKNGLQGADAREARDAIDAWQAEAENAKIQADYRERQKKQIEAIGKAQKEWDKATLAGLSEQDQAIAKVHAEFDEYRAAITDAAVVLNKPMAEVYDSLESLGRAEAEAIQKVKDKSDDLSQFQIQAFRNMQDAGAGFFESLRTGSDGWLSNFERMTLKMVDQWASAQMMMGLAGEDFGKGGALGGLIGTAATSLVGMIGGGGIGSAAAPGTSYTASYDSMVGTSDGFDFSSMFGGGRESGGPVSAGKMYEVNEQNIPELLNTGGRQYLMMGSQGGLVTPVGGSVKSPATESNGGGVAPISITIIAADAQSITEMMQRNPQAILGPLRAALQGGDRGLRADLQRVIS